MKKAGYHPCDEGICYGVAWAALLACVRQDGQAYIQRMQYLAQMDNPPLPGTLDTHQIYPFFDAVTLSMTSYKNMSGYEKGIGYPGRQEVAFPGRVIGGHEPDYQVPVVKQTFIAECTPETFIRFLQQMRENNNGIPFGVMIHYRGHATSIGFDGSKWLATDHDSHYYTETIELLYSFFDEQGNHYKDGRIIAAMEMVAGNEHDLNITGDALVVNAKKSVSAPLALHLALQYGDVHVTTDCIKVIGQQAHTPETLLEQLNCKDARGTPGLYMALQKGHADAITAFMQAGTTMITALPFTEAQKAELLCRLFSSKNACLHSGAQTCPQETTGNIISPGKRTPSGQINPKAKRSKSSAEKGKQGTNLQTGTATQGSRMENAEPEAQQTIEVATELSALQGYLKFRMNDTESEAAKKLFQVLNSKKIRIKETFHKLLANNVERKNLPSFCAKASVFFGALTDTIKDTGCLTSMLMKGKKYSQSFVAREDAELEYLARLDTFRCFSSMNNRKGLPQKEAIEEMLDCELWKQEGVFSMELFRAFSSMNSGKGLPKKETVEALLGWELWKQEGVFSMKMFRAFSSMNNGKGLPKKEEVEALLDWDIWKPKGVFSMELFRAFSSINHHKGLSKKEAVEEMLGWLKCEEPDGLLFQLISRLYTSEGIPDIKKLKQYEQKLLNLFFSDSVIGLEDNDKNKHRRLMQPVVLFMSTRKPQYILNFRDVEHFYQQVAGEPDSKLEKLLKLLISYGGEGVSRYLTLNDDHREALIELSSLHAPLPLTMQAVTDFSPQERKLYLFFTRNLKAPPDKDQWSDLGLQLRRLASVLKTPNNQRRYLEIIWHLAPSDRNTFLDEARVECIISVFPSLSALEKLAKSHSQSKLKALFKACEQFIQKNPSRENIERLFAALLETRLFLYLDDDIPDHFLSEYTAVEGSATFIAVTPETGTTEKLALYFVASVTRVLSRMFYYCEANRLKIRLCEGQIESFQTPALEIQDKGIKISNWPVWMFLHFLAVTEFPKSCYFSQEDWQQYCNPMFPLSLTQDKSETSTNPPPVTVEETLSEEEQFQRLWENLSRKALLEDVDLQVLTGYEQYMTMDHIVKILDKVHTSVEPHKLDKLKQLLDEKKTLYLIEDLFPPLSDEVINYLMETEIPWIPE